MLLNPKALETTVTVCNLPDEINPTKKETFFKAVYETAELVPSFRDAWVAVNKVKGHEVLYVEEGIGENSRLVYHQADTTDTKHRLPDALVINITDNELSVRFILSRREKDYDRLKLAMWKFLNKGSVSLTTSNFNLPE